MTTQLRTRLVPVLFVLLLLLASAVVQAFSTARADTLNPVADAYVKSNNDINFGTLSELRTYNLVTSGTSYRSYLKFDLTAVTGTITDAKLKLWTTSTSGSGYTSWAVADTSWTETGIKWSNKPGLGAQLGSSGAISANSWTEVNVTAGTTAGQLNSFAVSGLSGSDLHYHSKEGTNDPQLVLTVTAPPSAPTVTTGTASNVAQTTATLNGTVNPNGSATTCHFEYGLTTSYGTNTPNDTSPGAGTSAVPVSANISGLTASTLYHFRLVCSNSGGTTNGADATFTTTAAPPPSSFPQGVWTSGSASGLTDAELATLCGSLHYNFVLANPDVSVLDRVNTAGCKAVIWLGGYRDYNDGGAICTFNWSDATVTEAVNLVKNHPATKYWFVDDEPHVGVCTNSPQQMLDRSNLIKSLDTNPDHKTLLTENEYETYAALANKTDILGLVAYPCSHTNGCQASVITTRVNAAQAAGVAHYWAMVQITQDSWYRMPTATELQWIYDQWALTAREGEFTFMWDGGGSGLGLSDPVLGPPLYSTVTAHNDAL